MGWKAWAIRGAKGIACLGYAGFALMLATLRSRRRHRVASFRAGSAPNADILSAFPDHLSADRVGVALK